MKMSETEKGSLTSQIKLNMKFSKKALCFVPKIVTIVIFTMVFVFMVFSPPLDSISEPVNKARIPMDDEVLRDPAIVWYTYGLKYLPLDSVLTCYNGSRTYNCGVFTTDNAPNNPEAYIFYGHDIDRFPLPRDPKTIWGLIHEETPIARPMLMFEKALNLFNYSSTFSRHSDVPLILFWMRGLNSITDTQYFIQTSTKNSYLRENAPVMFFQSNCFTFTERDSYVKKLMKYIQVDCFGACLHNKELPPNNISQNYNQLYDETTLKFLARYKFAVTIENAVCVDYVTEKFWRAIELGVVPIYYGSPLIRDWLPNNKSAILLEDFPTPQLLSEHLHYLLNNDTAYEEYLEHKTLGLISNQRLIDEMTTRSYQNDYHAALMKFECFICERLHVKDTPINIVTRKHYDCPLPTSALSLGINFNNAWLEVIEAQEAKVDAVYKEMEASNKTRGMSITTWVWNYIFYKFNGFSCKLDFVGKRG